MSSTFGSTSMTSSPQCSSRISQGSRSRAFSERKNCTAPNWNGATERDGRHLIRKSRPIRSGDTLCGRSSRLSLFVLSGNSWLIGSRSRLISACPSHCRPGPHPICLTEQPIYPPLSISWPFAKNRAHSCQSAGESHWVRLVKIDVEGAEVEVMAGIRELLAALPSDVGFLVEVLPETFRAVSSVLPGFHACALPRDSTANYFEPRESRAMRITHPPAIRHQYI